MIILYLLKILFCLTLNMLSFAFIVVVILIQMHIELNFFYRYILSSLLYFQLFDSGRRKRRDSRHIHTKFTIQ